MLWWLTGNSPASFVDRQSQSRPVGFQEPDHRLPGALGRGAITRRGALAPAAGRADYRAHPLQVGV